MIEEDDLIKYLRCPDCKGKLTYSDLDEYLVCNNCQQIYKVIEGIPDLFPLKNKYSVGIVERYEDFGKKASRGDSIAEIRRRNITIDLIEGNMVLEIGCAEGWMSESISKKANILFSCDIAMSYLQRAKKRGINANFARIDAHCLPFSENLFDCVVITEVLEHLIAPYRALEEIRRILKPKGILIISVPNNMNFSNLLMHFMKKYRQTGSAHINFYDVFSIMDLLKFVGFEMREITPSFILIPLPIINKFMSLDWIQNFLSKIFPYFGDTIIVKAEKVDYSIWDSI